MTVAETEREAAERVAEKYRRDGYVVTVDPLPGDLPAGLRDHPPDLIALREDGNVAFDLVVRGSRESGERARRVSEAVRGVPGWSYHFVALPPERRSPRWMTDEEAASRLTAAETVAGADPSAAVLLAWTVIERSLRRLVTEMDGDPGPAPNPRRLVKQAYSLTGMTDDRYAVLNRLADQRNRIAHGARGERVTRRTAEAAVRIARDLMRTEERAAADTAT